MKESDLYRPLELPKELSGLNQDIICSLRNTLLTHGLPIQGSTCLRLISEEPDISIAGNKEVNSRTMMLIANGIADEGVFAIKLAHIPGFEPAILLWDRRITVEQVENIIHHAPEIRKKMDEAVARGETKKLEVERIFRNPGMTYPLLPGGPEADELLNSFDHPEELEILEQCGMFSIVRKRDTAYLRERQRIAEIVLAEEGIGLTNLEKIDNIPVSKILELRAKIEARLRN